MCQNCVSVNGLSRPCSKNSAVSYSVRKIWQCECNCFLFLQTPSQLLACSTHELSRCLCVLPPAVQYIVQQRCCESRDRPAFSWWAVKWYIVLLHSGSLILQLHVGRTCFCHPLHRRSMYPFEILPPHAAHVNWALKVNTSISVRVCWDTNTQVEMWVCAWCFNFPPIDSSYCGNSRRERHNRSNKLFPSCRRLSHTLIIETSFGEPVIHFLPQSSISSFISFLILSLSLCLYYCFNSKLKVHPWYWVKIPSLPLDFSQKALKDPLGSAAALGPGF